MQNVLVMLSFIMLGAEAKADQAISLSCVGSKITLTSRSPYLGDNSEAAQTLYVLKASNNNDNETKNTAYFLTVGQDDGGSGTLVFTGTNEKGGSFELKTKVPQVDGNGTILRMHSEGTITYSHGVLVGSDNVSCVFE